MSTFPPGTFDLNQLRHWPQSKPAVAMQSEWVKGECSGGSPNCLFWGARLFTVALSLVIFVSGCATAPVTKTAAPAAREIPSKLHDASRGHECRRREFALTVILRSVRPEECD